MSRGLRDLDVSKLGAGYGVAQDNGVSKMPRRGGSKAEENLAFAMEFDQVPTPEREFLFSSTRKWRFDFAWPDHKFAVEVEGVTYEGDRHQRVEGFIADLVKYEAAMLNGWTVYRCSSTMINSGRALEVIKISLGLTDTK